MVTLQELDKKFFPVHNESGFKIVTKHGFTPTTTGGYGLVRKNIFVKSNIELHLCVGVSGDYFIVYKDGIECKRGWTSALESYLMNL